MQQAKIGTEFSHPRTRGTPPVNDSLYLRDGVRESAEILHGIVSYNCLFTHQNSSISEMVRW